MSFICLWSCINGNPEWIRPAGEETAALVNYLARFIAKDTKVRLVSDIYSSMVINELPAVLTPD